MSMDSQKERKKLKLDCNFLTFWKENYFVNPVSKGRLRDVIAKNFFFSTKGA